MKPYCARLAHIIQAQAFQNRKDFSSRNLGKDRTSHSLRDWTVQGSLEIDLVHLKAGAWPGGSNPQEDGLGG